MTRRTLLASAALAPARPRNIIFVLSDDHRHDFLGCAGHPWLQTPHLDRMAAEGVRFRNAFVTTSLCSPSRASILTGLYMHAHGVRDNFQPLPPNLATFPKSLRAAGYATAFIGKWHMGDSALEGGAADNSDMPQPGFDHWISFRGQGEYTDPLLNINGQRRKTAGYTTDILTEEAERFLARKRSKPYLLYVSHKAVHAGFEPAPRHAELYTRDKVPNLVTRSAQEPEWLTRKRTQSRHGLDNLYGGEYTIESLHRQYARTLAALDDSVGRIVRAAGDDPLIIYMGDNGYLLGEHGLVDKRVMYEPSIRVPMIARCPALFNGGRGIDAMALNLDIAPTILEAAGLRIPPSLHGRSLMPLLRAQTPEWRREFLYEYFWDWEAMHTPGIFGLRTESHSLMEYEGVWDTNELHDLRTDPAQLHNLLAGTRVDTEAGGWLRKIRDPDLRKLTLDLRRRMAHILRQTGGERWVHGPLA